MFQTSFSTIGKRRRTVRLGVETLDGRDLPSTLPVVSFPALQAVWPPPPPNMQVSYLGDATKYVAIEHIGEEIPQRLPGTEGEVLPFVHHEHVGEEIPQ